MYEDNDKGKKDYVSLLEQALQDQFNRSKIGPMSGMDYRGIPVDGDDIRNWDGPEPIKTGKDNFDDVEDLVSKITDDEYQDVKAKGSLKTGSKKLGEQKTDESPLSVLEMEDELKEATEDTSTESEEVVSAIFEDKESEIVTRLIREMKALDEASSLVEGEDEETEQTDEDEEDGPILDVDDDDDESKEEDDDDEEDEDEDEEDEED